jgi:hypothetical protein
MTVKAGRVVIPRRAWQEHPFESQMASDSTPGSLPRPTEVLEESYIRAAAW